VGYGRASVWQALLAVFWSELDGAVGYAEVSPLQALLAMFWSELDRGGVWQGVSFAGSVGRVLGGIR
jgi:hypothetical protein